MDSRLVARGLSVVLVCSVLLLSSVSPARASDFFYYSCFTYATLNGYQADRWASGNWNTYVQISATNYTFNANASAPDNDCRYQSPYAAEASNYLQPKRNGIWEEMCSFSYSGIQYTGRASASSSCSDVNYEQVFVQMGHRAWLGYGQYRDDYPVAYMCPYGC